MVTNQPTNGLIGIGVEMLAISKLFQLNEIKSPPSFYIAHVNIDICHFQMYWMIYMSISGDIPQDLVWLE